MSPDLPGLLASKGASLAKRSVPATGRRSARGHPFLLATRSGRRRAAPNSLWSWLRRGANLSHPAWLLSLSLRGHRTTMYVPQALVATVKKAIQNGHRIEQLLYRAGPELIRKYRKTIRNP